jgi:hypothetical protein
VGNYSYDIQQMKQTNLKTDRVRNIRKVLFDDEFVWEYEDNNGQWEPMSGSISRLLNISEASGETTARVKHFTYDLSRMIQTNTATKKERSIRHVSVVSSAHGSTLWEFRADKSWEPLAANISAAIQEAVRNGNESVAFGKYLFDLKAKTQTNTLTNAKREIRFPDPDWGIVWEFEGDAGSWQPISATASAVIQDAVRLGKESVQFGGDVFDLAGMTRTAAGQQRRIRPTPAHCALFWEYMGDDSSWQPMSAGVSAILQAALRRGEGTATLRQLSLTFDLAGRTQTNTATNRQRRLRHAAPDRGVVWLYEDDGGAWQPMAGPASDEIQRAVEAGAASAEHGGRAHDLVRMAQTAAGAAPEAARRIRPSPLDPRARAALRLRRGYRRTVQRLGREVHEGFGWAGEHALFATRTRHRRSFTSPAADLCGEPQYADVAVEAAGCGAERAAAFARLAAAGHAAGGGDHPLLAHRAAAGLHELLRAPWVGPGPAGPDAADPRVLLGWHGASDEAAAAIVRDGFDPARAGTGAGHMFGRAFYFAERSSKADLYAGPADRRFRRPAGRVRVLLCLVYCGSMFEARARGDGWAAPPPPTAEQRAAHGVERCDSVLAQAKAAGGLLDSREWVVFDPAQALPVAVVSYRHADACACCRCVNP